MFYEHLLLQIILSFYYTCLINFLNYLLYNI